MSLTITIVSDGIVYDPFSDKCVYEIFSPSRMQSVAAHEIGHAIGLEHGGYGIMQNVTSYYHDKIDQKLSESVRLLYNNTKPDLRFESATIRKTNSAYTVETSIRNVGLAKSESALLYVSSGNYHVLIGEIRPLGIDEASRLTENITLLEPPESISLIIEADDANNEDNTIVLARYSDI